MSIETLISKTNAYVGETITCSTSGTTTLIAYTYWIINFSQDDMAKSVTELRQDGKVFSYYNKNSSQDIILTDSHISIETITPILLFSEQSNWITPLMNYTLNTLSSNPVSMIEIRNPINMTVTPVSDDKDVMYYVNITKKPVSELDSVSVEVETESGGGVSDKFSIVSSDEYNELVGELDDIRSDCSLLLNPLVNDFFNDVEAGNRTAPYSEYSTNLKKDDEIIPFSNVKKAINDIDSKIGLEDEWVETEYPTQTDNYTYTRSYWDETSGNSGEYYFQNDNSNILSVDPNLYYEYSNISNVKLRIELTLKTDNAYVYASMDSENIRNTRLYYDEPLSFRVNPNQTLYIDAVDPCQLNYTVYTLETVMVDRLIDKIYPKGSIYLTLQDIDPNVVWGGIWEKIEGKFLIGSDSTYVINTSSGSASITLTEAQMPRHTHLQDSHNHTQEAHTHSQKSHTHTGSAKREFVTRDSTKSFGIGEKGSSSGSHHYSPSIDKNDNWYSVNTVGGTVAENNTAVAKNKAIVAVNQYTGGGESIDILPPYLAVYMWQRIL